MLNCYYAHSDQDDGLQVGKCLSSACVELYTMHNTTCCSSPANSGIALQRRCYWLLDGDDGTVLVHYLASKKLGRANSDPRCQSEPMLPHFWDTARVEDYETSPYPHKAQRCYHGGLQDTCMHFEQVLSLWDYGLAAYSSYVLHPVLSKIQAQQHCSWAQIFQRHLLDTHLPQCTQQRAPWAAIFASRHACSSGCSQNL